MATYTSHLNLKLPDYSDTADIKDLNDNFKKIDDAIASGGTETDPTVPAWAKQPSKPTYTAGEVGARPDTWMPSASEVGADASGTAAAQVGAHNVSGEAHADLRALIEVLTSRLNALADSDDETLDQLSEIVAYIKSNKSLIDAVTTGKVSTSDIVDNLTTNSAGKVLSAAQGVRLKALIDAIVIPDKLPNPQPLTINGQSYDGSEAVTVTTVEIDDTLTQSGKAADAKAVGDQLSALNQANEKQDERLTTLETASGIVTIEPAQDDVPLIFYGNALPQTKTSTTMPITYVSKSLKYDGMAETKAQGTSSMSYAKKNQTTKFDRKFNFKGWGEQNKFCLKANWIDITHARNIVSAQIWGDVVKSRANYADLPELLRTSPNQGAIDGFPALVYANGVYQGRYTINIPKDGWMANMDKTLDTHCILCGENYVSGCFRAAANINGSDWSDELHDTVPDAIKTRWNEVISFVMNSTDDEFKAGLSDYFYVDSLIDYLLFALASCGLDSMGKNQLYMTYDGQKWIASMYDMDSTWGLYWNGSSFVASDYARTSYEDYVNNSGNLLYIRLEQNFYEEIQARWAELKAGPLSYENIMTRFERFIGIVPPHVVKEDYASTTGGGSFTGIPSQSTNNIQQIRSFALARQEWTDEYVAALTPAEEIPCTGITLDQSALTFTAAGTQTLTATVTPSDTTDSVVWSTSAGAVATVSDGVVTAVGDGDATITATCGEYSAACTVSVSGMSTGDDGSDIPSDGIVYQMAEPTAFNGTSDYIDTGVKLFDTQKDFTAFFDVVSNNASASTLTAAHAMNEVSPYPGLTLMQHGNGVLALQIVQGVKVNSNSHGSASEYKALARVSGSTAYTRMVDNMSLSAVENSADITYTQISQNLLLGCYQAADGTKGRFWSGTINRCVVWDRALSDEEIDVLFASLNATGVLYENYSPNGEKFSKVANIDWETQKLRVVADCSGYTWATDNVLSVGLAIDSWRGGNIHLYTQAAGTIQVNYQVVAGTGVTSTPYTTAVISDKSNVVIDVTKDGVYVDGVLYPPDASGDVLAMESIVASDRVMVGSLEGTKRSYATYKSIAIVPV